MCRHKTVITSKFEITLRVVHSHCNLRCSTYFTLHMSHFLFMISIVLTRLYPRAPGFVSESEREKECIGQEDVLKLC